MSSNQLDNCPNCYKDRNSFSQSVYLCPQHEYIYWKEVNEKMAVSTKASKQFGTIKDSSKSNKGGKGGKKSGMKGGYNC